MCGGQSVAEREGWLRVSEPSQPSEWLESVSEREREERERRERVSALPTLSVSQVRLARSRADFRGRPGVHQWLAWSQGTFCTFNTIHQPHPTRPTALLFRRSQHCSVPAPSTVRVSSGFGSQQSSATSISPTLGRFISAPNRDFAAVAAAEADAFVAIIIRS